MPLDAIILEAEYGPQPYRPDQGGAAVFRGRVKNAADADSIEVLVRLMDELGREIARRTAQAQRDPASEDWCFLVPWKPSKAEAPDGYYAPTFEVTAKAQGGTQVVVQDVCNGIQIIWVPGDVIPGTGPTGGPEPPADEGGPVGGRIGELIGEGVAPGSGGDPAGRDINCNTHPWLPQCAGVFPWQWRKDPRIDKPPGNPPQQGPRPPDNRPKPKPQTATPSTGSMTRAGNDATGDGPGGSCRIR